MADARAKRICARCEVRRECLTEALTNEQATTSIVRNVRLPKPSERALPVGIWGGQNAEERHAKDLEHLPIPERVDLLEARFHEMSPRWLTASERVGG